MTFPIIGNLKAHSSALTKTRTLTTPFRVKAHSTSVFGSAFLHRLKSGFLSIASLLLLTSCAGPSLEPVTGEEHGDPQLFRKVDGLVRKLMHKNHVPGLSIGIVHEGRTLVLRGYGEADRENDI